MGLKIGPFEFEFGFRLPGFGRRIRSIQRMQDLASELKEDRGRAGGEGTLAASKLAKDTGASTEEAASLVEEARDSAVDEVKED